MSISATIVVVIAAVAGGTAAGYRLAPRRRRPARERPPAGGRILLPFTGPEISRRAFGATVRLAKAEGATIVPAFLARVPRYLPLDSPLPTQCSYGMPLIEAIEQRAAAQGVPVESRTATGRTYRDALHRVERVSATGLTRHSDRAAADAGDGRATARGEPGTLAAAAA
jgi:hypothetical protein